MSYIFTIVKMNDELTEVQSAQCRVNFLIKGKDEVASVDLPIYHLPNDKKDVIFQIIQATEELPDAS